VDTAGLSSTVTGRVERAGEASLLHAIHVRYRLPIDRVTDRGPIARALAFHAGQCGIYRSLHPQITITTELELIEVQS